MKAAQLWPLAIVGVLGVTIVANVAVMIAARDPHADAVEPDYYRKAVAWDSTLAERERSLALGWRIDASIAPLTRAGAAVEVSLHDRRGAAIEAARLRVLAIHNLEPDRPIAGDLRRQGPGLYAATLPLDHPGLWELRIAATRGADRFTTSLRCDAEWAPAEHAGRVAALPSREAAWSTPRR